VTTNTYQITVGDLLIDVVRKDIKNLHLGVYPPHGRVRIATPLKVDDERVRLFAISKLHWIKKQQAKFQAQVRQSPREFVSGESHYFQGHRYLLNVVYHKSAPKVIIRNKTYLDLYVREGSNAAQREKVLTDWYRTQLKQEIAPLMEKWTKIIGVTVNEWRVKKMKTKWGSCAIYAKRIWFNLELIKKSPQCLEYVLVHELVHLLERHHNEKFQAYMSKFLPNWGFYHQELNSGVLTHDIW